MLLNILAAWIAPGPAAFFILPSRWPTPDEEREHTASSSSDLSQLDRARAILCGRAKCLLATLELDQDTQDLAAA